MDPLKGVSSAAITSIQNAGTSAAKTIAKWIGHVVKMLTRDSSPPVTNTDSAGRNQLSVETSHTNSPQLPRNIHEGDSSSSANTTGSTAQRVLLPTPQAGPDKPREHPLPPPRQYNFPPNPPKGPNLQPSTREPNGNTVEPKRNLDYGSFADINPSPPADVPADRTATKAPELLSAQATEQLKELESASNSILNDDLSGMEARATLLKLAYGGVNSKIRAEASKLFTERLKLESPTIRGRPQANVAAWIKHSEEEAAKGQVWYLPP